MQKRGQVDALGEALFVVDGDPRLALINHAVSDYVGVVEQNHGAIDAVTEGDGGTA